MTSLVSIIVTCYNKAPFLAETLHSVEKQTYPNWECIIVNDGSTDDSKTIAMEFCAGDKRFKYLEQENSGLCISRNNGIKNSKGEYILPLDADDIIGEQYLEKALNVFISQPDTKLVYCNAEKFGTTNGKWDLPPYSYEELLWRNLIFCSAIYRKTDYDNTSGYNPNMKYGYEDWDFWLTLLKPTDKVVRLDDILFHYRQHQESMITNTLIHSDELLRQIFLNHREIYEPYICNIINYRNKKEELDASYTTVSNLMSSNEYVIGRTMLKRFPLLCRLFFKMAHKRKKMCDRTIPKQT